MKSFKPLLALGLAAFILPSAHAGLTGTSLTLSLLGQLSAGSPPYSSSFPRSALVSDTAVEFPDVQSLFGDLPVFSGYIVNTSIDVSDTSLVIDFKQAGSGWFASAYQNTYVFTFDSAVAATITGASIDTSVTTLGLSASDVTFLDNKLFVNVEGLTFNSSTFVRINLTVDGGPLPVPEPGALAMAAAGLFAVGLRARSRRDKMAA